MLHRTLLDDRDYRVTLALFRQVFVTAKQRRFKVRAQRKESEHLFSVVDTLKKAGVDIAPGNEIVEELLHCFAEAVTGRGSWFWQVFFSASPLEVAAIYVSEVSAANRAAS